MKGRIVVLVAALGLLAGCSYPHAVVSTVDARPHLSIAHAPPGATLTVDGVRVGDAASFRPGVRALALDRGTHHVVIRDGARVLFDNVVYLGGGTTRTIDLPR